MKKSTNPSLCLFLFMLVLVPRLTHAAGIFFEPEKNYGVKDQFKINVFLTSEESVNAVEGKISFPADLLELARAEDSNSIINLWLERPGIEKTGEVSFSGITPGGYKGGKVLIFSLIFLVKQEGSGVFEIHDARVLRNDGQGTEAPLQKFDSQFIVSKKTQTIPVPISEVKDNNAPELFTPEIAENSALFDGKKFIAFTAQDKGTGIDHYEIKESRYSIASIFQKWISAKSPYILTDQELRSYIFVKAVDMSGNERIVALQPRNPVAWYGNYENWFIIVIGFVIVLGIKKKLWKGRIEQ